MKSNLIYAWYEIEKNKFKNDLISGLVLMSGIILVTKPSFLFSIICSNEPEEDLLNMNISYELIQKNDTGKACNY